MDKFVKFGSFLLELFMKLAPLFTGVVIGKKLEQGDEGKKELEGMKDAKAIHERVDTDPVYRDGVRNKFRKLL